MIRRIVGGWATAAFWLGVRRMDFSDGAWDGGRLCASPKTKLKSDAMPVLPASVAFR